MLNKNHNHFILLKCKVHSIPFVFPIPLFIFKDLLKTITDLFAVWVHFLPISQIPQMILASTMQLLIELEEMGSLELIDVSAKEFQLTISLE
ncbi:hypothetical protein [Acetonema longum]|uniref:Uncharacterized protein n=1 Tax=Acetonema longum DSM 6540 TaxID=1009370 RepID=F7NG94_9FIRM|nr:hypothetical protein [Acetonema longum]EGO65012.1 hypothetical protein ALO_05403 [Acetonema longum DSM 6540]